MTEYKPLLDAIRAASRDLNQAAEAATETVSSVEKRLLEAEPGVTVWHAQILEEQAIHQDDGGAVPAQRRVTLGFAKVKGKWGIAVRDELWGGDDAQPLSTELGLLRKAERDLRIAALPHLEALLQSILEALRVRAARLSLAHGPQLQQAEEAAPATDLEPQDTRAQLA